MPQKGQKRDVSRVINALQRSDLVCNGQLQITARLLPNSLFLEVIDTLIDIDARTGRRDPSKRTPANRKPTTRKR